RKGKRNKRRGREGNHDDDHDDSSVDVVELSSGSESDSDDDVQVVALMRKGSRGAAAEASKKREAKKEPRKQGQRQQSPAPRGTTKKRPATVTGKGKVKKAQPLAGTTRGKTAASPKKPAPAKRRGKAVTAEDAKATAAQTQAVKAAVDLGIAKVSKSALPDDDVLALPSAFVQCATNGNPEVKVKKSTRKQQSYMLVFPGQIAVLSPGVCGTLENLGSATPVLNIEFDQAKRTLRLLGSVVSPKNSYLLLQFHQKGKDMSFETGFNEAIIFHSYQWVDLGSGAVSTPERFAEVDLDWADPPVLGTNLDEVSVKKHAEDVVAEAGDDEEEEDDDIVDSETELKATPSRKSKKKKKRARPQIWDSESDDSDSDSGMVMLANDEPLPPARPKSERKRVKTKLFASQNLDEGDDIDNDDDDDDDDDAQAATSTRRKSSSGKVVVLDDSSSSSDGSEVDSDEYIPLWPQQALRAAGALTALSGASALARWLGVDRHMVVAFASSFLVTQAMRRMDGWQPSATTTKTKARTNKARDEPRCECKADQDAAKVPPGVSAGAEVTAKGGRGGHREVSEDRLVHFVCEELLKVKCPSCRFLFEDFGGCFVLECTACGASFCGYCFADDEGDIFNHVRVCDKNPVGGNLFGSDEIFEQAVQLSQQRKLVDFNESQLCKLPLGEHVRVLEDVVACAPADLERMIRFSL
ncbi:DNA-binding protein RHL1 (Protein ELONGATED HYPOCOTYL 7) (Protein ROOT HAIRLESS 1), partial [Durusdinium trenchii]